MDYNIAVIGLNHKTAPVEIREALSFTVSQAEVFLKKLKTRYPEDEFVILSTCNRVEIYIGSSKEIDAVQIRSLLIDFHNSTPKAIVPLTYVFNGQSAVTHLFEVGAGLDSLVIGEIHVSGQVKRSYRQAFELGLTGKVFNRLFQRAFFVTKKVRKLTKIGEGNVSISSVACRLAEEVLEDLSQRKVLLIGAGKIGALTLKSLRDRGADTILVSSRNYNKAKVLAEEFSGIAVKLEELDYFMQDVDVVISSTSAPHYILDYTRAKKIIEKRNNKPIFLIDLAVPRDIDPKIKQIKSAHLYNIDSLKSLAEQNIKKRENEIFQCKKIIYNEMISFMNQNRNNNFFDRSQCGLERLSAIGK